jgi:hypothetical protein
MPQFWQLLSLAGSFGFNGRNNQVNVMAVTDRLPYLGVTREKGEQVLPLTNRSHKSATVVYSV